MSQQYQSGESGPTSDDDRVGQIVSETARLQSHPDPSSPKMTPAIERSALIGDDAGVVNAVHVNMERSGAEQIEAQRVTLENSGVRSLTTESAELIDSGALRINAARVVFNDSTAFMTSADEMRIDRSKVGVAVSDTSALEHAGPFGMLVAGNIDASGDVNATLMITGNVTAGGDVNITFNAASACALGAVFATTLFLLRRIFSR